MKGFEIFEGDIWNFAFYRIYNFVDEDLTEHWTIIKPEIKKKNNNEGVNDKKSPWKRSDAEATRKPGLQFNFPTYS
jgi:hypothetical protein